MSQATERRDASPYRRTGVTRIGFVDHDLDNFHANVYLDAFRGPLADRGVEVAGCTALRGDAGAAWAAAKDVPYFDDAAALASEIDAVVVLAPSNPECHLELCRQVLPAGKPTFVDKKFAPDAATARAIFDLADQHGAPVQTSSALRYTNVQAVAGTMQAESLRHMVAWGEGGSFEEYAIHPVELVVSCLGHEAMRLARRGAGDESQLLIDFTGGRTAVVNVYTNARTPFAATLSSEQQTCYVAVETGPMFEAAAAAMLDFFDAGRPLIDRRETLAIMRILDTAEQPEGVGRFIDIR